LSSTQEKRKKIKYGQYVTADKVKSEEERERTERKRKMGRERLIENKESKRGKTLILSSLKVVIKRGKPRARC
jgi:hypothetical protein